TGRRRRARWRSTSCAARSSRAGATRPRSWPRRPSGCRRWRSRERAARAERPRGLDHAPPRRVDAARRRGGGKRPGRAGAAPEARRGGLERTSLRRGTVERDGEGGPVEVAMDEAVPLAKRYSSEDAGRLVNGILGRIVKEPAA